MSVYNLASIQEKLVTGIDSEYNTLDACKTCSIQDTTEKLIGKLPLSNNMNFESLKFLLPSNSIGLWRYHITPQKVHQHRVIEGVLFEISTNKVLAWTIEDLHDVNYEWLTKPCRGKKDKIPDNQLIRIPLLEKNNSFNPRVPSQLNKLDCWKIVPAGFGWCNDTVDYHAGCCYYCQIKANGRGGFGNKSGAKNRMLGVLGAGDGGCLFHPGKDDGWCTGCVLIGTKAINGRRNFDKSIYFKNNITKSNDMNAVYYRRFYDYVVPKICNGKTVYLWTLYEEGTPKTNLM